MSISGKISIVLIIILIISGVIYFQFMNDTKQGVDEIIPSGGGEIVLKTNFGDIELELFADKAPATVENFKKLVQEGFYNGVKFHRIIKGFMIQGGDPLTKDDSQKINWGMGGPGYAFNDELYTGNSNVMGTIAMANAGPNTNGSQFFINTADNNSLDSKHVVFGKVVNGMEVVAQIENVAVGERDIPIEPVVIESATLINQSN